MGTCKKRFKLTMRTFINATLFGAAMAAVDYT